MARFEYAARDETGKATSGEIVAASRAEAARLLRGDGKFVVRLNEMVEETTQRRAPVKRGSRRIKQDQVIHFTNQLAVMVDTGVPLADALKATIEDEPPGGFRSVIEDVISQVQAGQEFSASLERHPKVFPRYFSNIIRASEASGLLGTMLQRVAAYMLNQRDMRKRVQGAMMYPVAMVAFCLGVVVFLMSYILPKFTRIFESKKVPLPVPTQVLMAASNFLTDNWYWIVPILLLGVGGVWYFLRTPSGYKSASFLRISMPMIGPMYRRAYITRCMRTMGTLIDSGVSMLDTVAITQNSVDNHYYYELFKHVDEHLTKGRMLSESLKGNPLFPHTLVQMVLAGERAGQLGPVLNRIADFCEDDLNNSIKSLINMIEPTLVIFIGTFIGAIAIALLMPIFTLSRVVAS